MTSTNLTNLNELNKIFFNNECKFFQAMDKHHKKEVEEFLKVYNNLLNLALNLENILPEEIKLLKEGTIGKFELTRKEAALIFLLSFFNLIDVTQEDLRPTNNFRVYEVLESTYSSAFEFGRCFVNYLTIIGKWLSENNPILDEKISYIRDSKVFNEQILEKETKLCEVEIHENGSLFDRDDSYCIDFANKYIGGGALQGGCVQEEILFATQPEAIVSMFFMEVMSNDDAIRIDNTIKYSNYTGYGYKFKFEESAIDFNDLNTIKRYKFIAIDACVQYTYKYGIMNKDDIIRDIHKSFVGFNLANFQKQKINQEIIGKSSDKINQGKEKEVKKEEKGKLEEGKEEEEEKGEGKDTKIKEKKEEKGEVKDIKIKEKKEEAGEGKDAKIKEKNEGKEKGEQKKEQNIEIKESVNEGNNISTGNWGCGAFGGDHELKFLQQWVSASFAGIKKLHYYTFGSAKMKFLIKNLDKIKEKYSTANNLYEDLTNKTLSEGEVLEILLGKEIPENDNLGLNLLSIK